MNTRLEKATPSAPKSGPIDSDAAELAILRLLQTNPDMSQRALSAALGMSLGKTHYLLRALMNKGSIKVRNFQRSDNKAAYMYLLTPAGIRKRLHLTRSFLARKEHEYVALQETIVRLREELREQGEQR
jgi:EPS-associated MarR family transcriptional regulator